MLENDIHLHVRDPLDFMRDTLVFMCSTNMYLCRWVGHKLIGEEKHLNEVADKITVNGNLIVRYDLVFHGVGDYSKKTAKKYTFQMSGGVQGSLDNIEGSLPH